MHQGRSDHVVARVNQFEHVEPDFGERLQESANEPLVLGQAEVGARVGFVGARVVHERGW